MNWEQRVKDAADDLKRIRVKIVCVQIGEDLSQDLVRIASGTSLVFGQSDIEGLVGTIVDMCGEMCGKSGFKESFGSIVTLKAPSTL